MKFEYSISCEQIFWLVNEFLVLNIINCKKVNVVIQKIQFKVVEVAIRALNRIRDI